MAHWNRFKREKRKDSSKAEDRVDTNKPSYRGKKDQHHGQRPGDSHGGRSSDRRADGGLEDYFRKLPMQRASEFLPERNHPGRPWEKPKVEINTVVPKRKSAVIFFDSMDQARSALERLKTQASLFDQINIVVKAEADMTDPVINSVGRLFAGTAWYTIHSRRLEEGYYDEKLS